MQTTPDDPLPVLSDSRSLPTWRAAYSDRTSAEMAAFCELAYLDSTDPRLRTALAGGGFTRFTAIAVDGLQAILAVNPSEFAVVAFQGTCDPQGWGFDLDALRMPLPGFPGVCVHRGFWGAWQKLEEGVRAAVDVLPADLGLYITGHSLGGALAQIASAELERDTLAACYTFGSPRVATAGFDVLVKCPHYRVVNSWDLVPGVPAASWWGYQHTGDARLLVGPEPLQVLRRGRNPVAELAVDLWSGAVWALTRRLAVADDHMIPAYRSKLERIASTRSTPSTNGG